MHGIGIRLPFHKLCLRCQALKRVASAFEPEPKFEVFKARRISSGKRTIYHPQSTNVDRI